MVILCGRAAQESTHEWRLVTDSPIAKPLRRADTAPFPALVLLGKMLFHGAAKLVNGALDVGLFEHEFVPAVEPMHLQAPAGPVPPAGVGQMPGEHEVRRVGFSVE